MFKWALDRGDTAVVDLLLQFNPALVDVKNNVSIHVSSCDLS